MLYEVIKHLYPAIQDYQFALRDDGQGPYIHRWDYSMSPPTQSEIDAAIPVVEFQSLVKQFDALVEAHLHAGAVAHGYTNIERACMYAAYPNPYQAESQSYVKWVGEVWAYCYQELQKIQQGIRGIPLPVNFLAELPQRVIPE